MNGTSVYALLDRYIESETNRKVNIQLDELIETLIANGIPSKIVHEAVKSQRYPVQSVLRLETEKKKRRKKNQQQNQNQQNQNQQNQNQSCGEDDSQKQIQPKKRGRRGKGKQINIENLDQAKYVQAILMKIGDISYLVDENDIVYNFNQNNEIVGYIKEEQIYWN
jgi:hypothetical protein